VATPAQAGFQSFLLGGLQLQLPVLSGRLRGLFDLRRDYVPAQFFLGVRRLVFFGTAD
jgi:hypothetical protein